MEELEAISANTIIDKFKTVNLAMESELDLISNLIGQI